MKIRDNPMVNTMLTLKGNARACIYTEPLWGIPYNLYAPYAAVYMRELGLTPSMIGLVASISLIVQFIFSLLSGVLTDKLGRRKCTLIFDIISWSIPMLIWAFAQNFYWFAIAAAFNGVWRVTVNSWGCLLVEDTPQEKIVSVFSLMYIAGLISAFFSPIAAYFVGVHDVVPTVRVLYGITFVMMTAKFLILFVYSKETQMGEKRLAATKNTSSLKLLWECKGVFLEMLKSKRLLITIAIMAVFQVIGTVNGNFWPLLVTSKLGIHEANLYIFSIVRSLIMLGCYFTIIPRISHIYIKKPMLTGWIMLIASQGILITLMQSNYIWAFLTVSIILEAFAIAILNPLIDSMLYIHVNPEERARILGMVYASVQLIAFAFPTLIGLLADIDMRLPFYINLLLFFVGIFLTYTIWSVVKKEDKL